MKVYDGEGMILGRLGSIVAKAALLGEEVHVVNCDKVIVSGKKVMVFANEKQKRDRKGHPLKSANFSRLSDRTVRRSIRGMLPWRKTRGREAFKRIMCHRDVPTELAGKEIKIEDASVTKLPTLQYITIGELCQKLRGKE